MSSKKTTTQTSTSTMTPTNPEWVTSGIQDQMGRIGALAGSDPYSYVAGPSALQNQAFGLAGQLGGGLGDLFGSASGIAQGLGSYQPQQVSASPIGGAGTISSPAITDGQVNAAGAFGSLGAADPTSALSSLLSGQASNPYLSAMNQGNIDAALRGYNDATGQAARTLTQSVLPSLRSGAMLSGQYGGSREGIAEGLAAGQVGQQLAQNARDLGIAAMDSGNQLYGTAYENAQQRQATTANNLAGLGLQTADNNANRDVTAQQSNAANWLQAQQANAANQLNSQQFNANQALQAAQANQSAGLQGAGLNLNAAQFLGGLGQYGLNTLGQLGATQQGLAQQYAQAPLALAQATNGMYAGLPLNLFNGNTTTGNSSGTETQSGLGHAISVYTDLVNAAARMAAAGAG